jgi:thiamine phosphate synthase YjbQ (UPF0047 family)
MMFVRTLVLCTRSYNEMTVLTPRVEEIVLESGVQEGMVTVLTRHTTTGVTVNEALECLESDIQTALALFAPEDDNGQLLHLLNQAYQVFAVGVEYHVDSVGGSGELCFVERNACHGVPC